MNRILLVFIPLFSCVVYSNRAPGKGNEIVLSPPNRFKLPQCPMRKRYKLSGSPLSPIQSVKRNGGGGKVKKVVVVTKVVYIVKPKKPESSVPGGYNKEDANTEN